MVQAEDVLSKKTCRRSVVLHYVCRHVVHILTSEEMSPSACEREPDDLLQCRFLLHPIIEVGLGQNVKICLHGVMPEAAKLGTNNFVPADLRCRKVQRNIQSRNKILLHTQLPHKKGMSNIFGMHEQMDFLVYGNRHLSRYDVVPGLWVVLQIQAEKVLRPLIDQLRMDRSEVSVRPRIAKIKGKLSGLHLYGHGVRGGRREIYVGPCLHSEHSEGHHLCAYQQHGRNH